MMTSDTLCQRCGNSMFKYIRKSTLQEKKKNKSKISYVLDGSISNPSWKPGGKLLFSIYISMCVCYCNSVSRRKLKIYFSFTFYDRWKWYWYIMPLICDMLVVIFVLAACHYLFTLLACSQCMLYSLMRLNSKKDRHHEAWPLIFSYWSAWHALKEKNERKYLKENHVNPLNSIWIWRKKAFYTI